MLMVDDNAHGFDTRTASDGLEALRVIQQQHPSLIILDLNMPSIDGWTVLRELGAHDATRHTPVIVVTAAHALTAAQQARAILQKPVMPHDVIPVIEKHLSVA